MGTQYTFTDKNGKEIYEGAKLSDGYDTCTAEVHWGEWYIVGQRDMWKFEQFSLDCKLDNTIMLVDFEIVEE